MKKLLSIMLVVCIAFTVLAVTPVGAEVKVNVLRRGTAVIDGKVDDIYKGSLTIRYVGDPELGGQMYGWLDATGEFYAMYDDEYLYLCGQVWDDDVVSASDIFVYENNNPYGNDCVEFRLDLAGGDPSSNVSFFKLGIDAYGKRVYSPVDLGISCDVDSIEYACSITDDGYIVELAYPYGHRDEDDFISVGEIGLKVWMFDLIGDYAGIDKPVDGVHFLNYLGESYEGEDYNSRNFYEVSRQKAADFVGQSTNPSTGDTTTAKQEDTTAKQDDTTAKQDDTTTKQDDTTAPVEDTTPSTFDPIVAIVALAAASGAAFVVASKKRK